MTDDIPNLRPIRRRAPRTDECEKIVRAIAMDSLNVKLTEHARERMALRGITSQDTFEILRAGHVTEIGREKGRLKCKIVRRIRGERDAGIVTLIIEDRSKGAFIIVKTVEWEDA